MQKTTVALALIAFLIPHTTQPIKLSDVPLISVAAAATGIALGLAYIEYASKASQKITAASNKPAAKEAENKQIHYEQIVKEAEQLIHSVHYNDDLSIIKSNGDLDHPSEFNETILPKIIVELTKNDNSYFYAPAIMKDIQKTLSSLHTVTAKLKQHIPAATLIQDTQVDTTQETIPSENSDLITPLIDALNVRIALLSSLHAFFRVHEAYMNLVQREKAVYRMYRSIIKSIGQKEIDNAHSAKIVHLLAADYPRSSHPYLDAHNSLREDIKSLYKRLDAVDAALYPQQVQSTQTLLEKLETIETIIITSNEIMDDRARREKQKLIKEKQDLENSWKEKELRLIEKQQQLEQEWQHKTEMIYDKAQKELQKISREKQMLEKEWKEREFLLIEKQQKLEKERQQKAAEYAEHITKEYRKTEQHMEQITKEYHITKTVLEDLKMRVHKIEAESGAKAAQ